LTTFGFCGDVVLQVLGVRMDSISDVVLGVGMVTMAVVMVVALFALPSVGTNVALVVVLVVVEGGGGGGIALRLDRDTRFAVGNRI